MINILTHTTIIQDHLVIIDSCRPSVSVSTSSHGTKVTPFSDVTVLTSSWCDRNRTRCVKEEEHVFTLCLCVIHPPNSEDTRTFTEVLYGSYVTLCRTELHMVRG